MRRPQKRELSTPRRQTDGILEWLRAVNWSSDGFPRVWLFQFPPPDVKLEKESASSSSGIEVIRHD
jgi:hypothetical protein